MKDIKLTTNQEDYLEAVFVIDDAKGAVRVKDVAQSLNVTSASVNGAMKLLAELGYVIYTPYELLKLTEKGQSYAEKIAEKHQILKSFMAEILMIKQEEAEKTACLMEHAMSCQMKQNLEIFTGFILQRDCLKKEWFAYLKEVQNEKNGSVKLK